MLGLISLFTGGIPWKLIGGGIMLLAIGILLWVHLSGDRAKDNKITELNTIITQLELDKVKLDLSNKSLEANIVRQREERTTIVRELTNLRKVDTTNQIALDTLRKLRTSKERKERIRQLTKSRKRSYILRAANRQANCQWDNYDNFDGHCVAGKYKE